MHCQLSGKKGIYVLMIRLENDSNIKIGRLCVHKFKKGIYLYVGSALNGLEHRIGRHLSANKKFKWHIDYLLAKAEIVDIVHFETADKRHECETADGIAKFADEIPVRKFGSSDCNCPSHLFYLKI